MQGTYASGAKTAYLGYFTGTRYGFSCEPVSGYNQITAFDAAWNKSGLIFGSYLHSRNGSPQTDHWMIASGQHNLTSTYHPNIGFRGVGPNSSYAGKHVGSWSSSTSSKSSTYEMSNSNVMSIWITDM